MDPKEQEEFEFRARAEAEAKDPPTPKRKNILQQGGEILKNVAVGAVKGVTRPSSGLYALGARALAGKDAEEAAQNKQKDFESWLDEKAGTSPGISQVAGDILPWVLMPEVKGAQAASKLPAFAKAAVDVLKSGALNAGAGAAYAEGAGQDPEAAAKVGGGLGFLSTLFGKAVPKLVSKLPGGASEDAVVAASSPAGRKGLAAAAERNIGTKGADGLYSGGNQTGKALADELASYENPALRAQKFPEEQVVNQAIEKMPPVSVQGAISALQKARREIIGPTGIPNQEERAIVNKIDAQIEKLKGESIPPNGPTSPAWAQKKSANDVIYDETPEYEIRYPKNQILGNPQAKLPPGKSNALLAPEAQSPAINIPLHLRAPGTDMVPVAGKPADPGFIEGEFSIPRSGHNTVLPASHVRDLRMSLDDLVDWNQPNAKKYDAALSAARTELENALRDAAPQEYREAMSKWSEKLNLLREVKGGLGVGGAKTETSDAVRAANLLKSVVNPTASDAEKRELLKKFQSMTGKDFLSPAREEALASEFGSSGKPGVLPPHLSHFAAPLVAGAYGFGHGGPMEAAKYALGAGSVMSPWLQVRAAGLGRGSRVLPPWIPATLSPESR